jgi:hypothetical protein
MNPITNKTVSKTAATGLEQTQSEVQKTAPSKFDRIRTDKLEQASIVPYELPPEVKQVPPQEKVTMQNQLTDKVNQTSKKPGEVLKVDLSNCKVKLDHLQQKVSALPKAQAYDPIRNRLAGIEQQYGSATQMLDKMGASNNPQDYIKLQMQMYLMTENVQLVSKVVDQVTGGIKTILQTQI